MNKSGTVPAHVKCVPVEESIHCAMTASREGRERKDGKSWGRGHATLENLRSSSAKELGPNGKRDASLPTSEEGVFSAKGITSENVPKTGTGG